MKSEALIEAFQAGETQALDRLLRFWRPQLVRFFSGDEDLTQETLLRVCRAARSWERKASFRTWLFVLARNVRYDDRKAAARASLLDSLDAETPEGQPLVETLESEDAGPEALLEASRARPALVAALRGLPANQLEAFVLMRAEGLPRAEVARRAGVDEKTIRSRMSCALTRLRKQLTAA